ncbi:MAG: acyl-CoA thioesterase, partial [Anaerolineales bacterium]|nr:acyl-CoA thioesterase [Anaerolineales bacterium]
EVRYADIDAQRHVNNVVFFTYMETARAAYLRHLGLWDGKEFLDIGIILVKAECEYLQPIVYGTALRVGVHTDRVGTKSLTLSYAIEDSEAARLMAKGQTVSVAYDYRRLRSMAVPPDWRRTIEAFEGAA